MISRRKFVSLVVVGATAASGVFLGYPVVRRSESKRRPLPTGDPLTDYALQLRGVATIGQRYLSTLAAEDADRSVIYKLVAEKIEYDQTMPAEQIPLHVYSSIQQQFIDGKICVIDGWNLSILECQLTALYVLSGGRLDTGRKRNSR